jgi:hypothetical protein
VATCETGLGEAPDAPRVLAQLLTGVGEPELGVSVSPSDSDGFDCVPPSGLPMRSGIASKAKAMNDSEPSTKAPHGAHRQVNTFGIPISRIRCKA